MKNKKVIIISGIIAIVVITAVILGILYFTTDLFKSNQKLFYKYLSKADIVDLNFNQKYSQASEKISNSTSSSTSNIDVSTSILNSETGVSDIQKIFSIKSNGLKNIEMNQTYRDFTLSANDNELVYLKFIKDGNTYAIGAENILSKYLSVENANLKDLLAKFGIQDTSTIPNSIPTNYEELLKIDETTLQSLKETYGTLMYNKIDETHFYKMTNEDGTEEIGISLTEQEVVDIFKLILETAKNDNTLLNLVITKAQLVGYTDITVENIQTGLQSYIDEISNGTYSKDEDFVKISLVKSGKNVAKIKCELNDMESASDTMITEDTSIETVRNKTNTILELDISKNNTIKMSIKENGQEIINSTINYSYDDTNINLITEITNVENLETVSSTKIQYQISNYNTDNIQQSCIIDITSDDKSAYQINMVTDTTIKQDVQIEKLTTENSAKLNDMTQEEIAQLITALANRINQVYGESLMNMYSNAIINNTHEVMESHEETAELEESKIQNYLNQTNTQM